MNLDYRASMADIGGKINDDDNQRYGESRSVPHSINGGASIDDYNNFEDEKCEHNNDKETEADLQ